MEKIVFLDRDGVINRYPGDTKYVTSLKEFRFLPRVKIALVRLTKAGCRIFIVSNQAGVTKGVYPQQELDKITSRMLEALAKFKVKIDGVYYCVHRKEDDCSCRKPKTGSLKKALGEHSIPRSLLKNAFFVGDTISDVQTGRNAGCKTILVFSGKEKAKNSSFWDIKPDFTARDLYQASDIILGRVR
ncbi:MAG: HAD-IIIA family hydrolase [Candidatus Omnitrophota bacterium]|nr:HAD-IIIA family hydrolase [Candidatus Omnitrophota bacterium]